MKQKITIAAAIILFGSLISAGFGEALGQDVQLGVYLQELTEESAANHDYDGEGVLISGIVEGSAAEKAGLEAGDIIVAFDGEMVGSPDQLIEVIRETKPGDQVKIVVFSDGETRKVKVKMGKKTEGLDVIKGFDITKKSYDDAISAYGKALALQSPEKWMHVLEGGKPFMGIQMVDLTKQLAAYFEVEGGVLVSEVGEDTPADEAGLKAGDIITSWNGKPLKKGADLTECLKDSETGDEIDLGIARRGDMRQKTITLGEPREADLSSLGYYFGDKDGTYRFRNFAVPPPTAKDAPNFKWFAPGLGAGQDDIREEMKEYKKQMESLRKQLEEMRNELQQMKKRNRS